jgi:hypothetical protein
MDEESDEFLSRVAAFIDTQDHEELRRQWTATEPGGVDLRVSDFDRVAIYAWSRVPCLVRRLARLVEWDTGP